MERGGDVKLEGKHRKGLQKDVRTTWDVRGGEALKEICAKVI